MELNKAEKWILTLALKVLAWGLMVFVFLAGVILVVLMWAPAWLN